VGAVRILAVGDFGVGGDRQRATGAAMKRFEIRYPATYLVTLGDNDYTESPPAFRRNWRRSFGWLKAADVRVAGTLGNHDYEVDDGRYQLATLGMPKPYYTRRTGDAQLFLLDSNDVDGTQTAWLARALAASTARWKSAAFHHPPWACGGHVGNRDVQIEWVPLFERYDVDLVLSGHDHSYQRFAPRNGVAYVVHGGGGAPLYPILGCNRAYPRLVFGRADYGFLSVVAYDDRLTVTAFDLRRRFVDRVILDP
jgi:Calcineurin-like phosphoesterase